MKLLIVDDDEGVRSALRAFLGMTFPRAAVTGATSGEEAVATAGILCPEVVLMDLRLPCMDGLEATRLILDRHPSVRVVILSGSDTALHRQRAAAAGAAAFLAKPAPPHELVAAIEGLVIDEPAVKTGARQRDVG